jgi:hypothetical protein
MSPSEHPTPNFRGTVKIPCSICGTLVTYRTSDASRIERHGYLALCPDCRVIADKERKEKYEFRRRNTPVLWEHRLEWYRQYYKRRRHS